MNTITKFGLAILGVVFAMSVSVAQDYKHPQGLVNEEGKVFGPSGKHIGWVTKEGVIKDSAGAKVAHIDSEGTSVDAKTGKKLGKSQKNGNFVPEYKATADDKWVTSESMNGSCEVKNSKGKTVVVVHENYKQFGACAYHCLTMKKEHKDMKMK